MDRLYELIRRFEGLRLAPYRCPAGIPTIGYGHTGPDVTMSSPAITPRLAEDLMREDAEKHAALAVSLSPTLAADPDRLCAIADFVFNLGPTRYRASTLRRRVDAQDWNGAREEIRKWVWGGGRKLPGLVLRREAEAALL